MAEHDEAFMTRELDRTKSDLFQIKYASFYGALLCSLKFAWDKNIPTACTDGVSWWWNPEFFLGLPRKSRLTVMMHELQHPAGCHFDRRGDRDPLIWNYATDIKINNRLIRESYSFEGLEGCWKDLSYSEDAVEEDIYDDLIKQGIQPPPMGCWGIGQGGDMQDAPTRDDRAKAVTNVIRAAQQAKMAGAGNMPSDIDERLSKFLAPVVPWQQLIHRFMTELFEEAFTWSKPNRRFCDMYLPSKFVEEGALAHLFYFEDVSGSISNNDMIRFNSEIKYIKEMFQPEKMTLIQFDTRIASIQDYDKDDEFTHVDRKGCGGTDLECVRQYILEKKPTAVIVFSDMECSPMGPLNYEVPILFCCVNNPKATVPFGQIVHVR